VPCARVTHEPSARGTHGQRRSLTRTQPQIPAATSSLMGPATAPPAFQAGHEGSIPFARSNQNPPVKPSRPARMNTPALLPYWRSALQTRVQGNKRWLITGILGTSVGAPELARVRVTGPTLWSRNVLRPFRAGEIRADKVCVGEGRVSEVRAGEVRAAESRASEGRAGKVRAGEVRATENRVSEGLWGWKVVRVRLWAVRETLYAGPRRSTRVYEVQVREVCRILGRPDITTPWIDACRGPGQLPSVGLPC
jgi:hypothetical protein